MKAYRAALLRSTDRREAVYEEDGMLVVDDRGHGPGAVARIVAAGAYGALAPAFPGVEVQHFPGRILAPGFIDLHVHFPQTDVIGSPAEVVTRRRSAACARASSSAMPNGLTT